MENSSRLFCFPLVQHFRLFPKSLGDVLAAYHVQELHLTQTQGKWRHQSWGYPVEDAPSGAQLWVWFKPTVTEYVLDLFSSFWDMSNELLMFYVSCTCAEF